jgi:hypothetical protein
MRIEDLPGVGFPWGPLRLFSGGRFALDGGE